MSDTGVKITGLPALPTRPTGTEPVVVVRGGTTYQAPSSYLDNLAPSIPYASELTGDEIVGLEQLSEPVLSTLNDQVRLTAARRAGLVFDTIVQAQELVGALGLQVGAMIATAAYSDPDVGGGALYEQVATEPVEGFQDDAGRWWALRSSVIYPEMFGAIGDGVADDTVAVQKAWDFVPDNGSVVHRGGRVYSCTNLVNPGRLTLTSDGLAIIKARAGGDSRYLVAPTGWLVNSAFSGAPIRVSNIMFDSNNLKDFGLIVNSFDSNFNGIECRGANQAGFYVTDITENGVAQGFTMGAMRVDQCIFRLNNGDGVRSNGQTDFMYVNSKSHTNGGWGWWFSGMGGGQLQHLYGFGNAAGQAYFNKFGFATIIADCEWDGDVTIDQIYNDITQSHVYGPGNIHKNGDLTCLMSGGATDVTLVLADVNLSGSSRIIHSYNGASRKLIVQGGSSSAPNPLVYHSGSSAGTMIAVNHYSRAAGGLLNGLVPKIASSDTSPIAPNILYLDKTLAAATTSTVVLTLTVPPLQNAGSVVRIKVDALSRSGGAIQTYAGEAVASYSRVLSSATNGGAAAMFNESAVGMSAVAAVALTSGTTGDQTATVTVTLTHGVPTASSTTMLRATAVLDNKYTSAATLA